MSTDPNPRRANGTARNKLRARKIAEALPCPWPDCPWPTDILDRSHDRSIAAQHGGDRRSAALDPRYIVIDEVKPIRAGQDIREKQQLALDPSNTRAMHRACNAARGDGSRVKTTSKVSTLIDW